MIRVLTNKKYSQISSFFTQCITSLCVIFLLFNTYNVNAQTWPTDTIHVQINTNDPVYPFPQFLEYHSGKSLAANNAVGVTHADMEKAMREAYQIMMHRALKVPGKVLNGVQYMQFNNNTVPQNYGTFVSEGDGYALLAAAYFADKPTFDGLWAWVHDNRLSAVTKYYDCLPLRAAYTYGAGFAGWECTDADGVGSTNINSAADGDVDIAMALLIASKQWPTGGINDACGNLHTYKAEALKMIKVMVDTLYYTTSPFGAQAGVKGYLSGIVGIDGYIKSGNTWGEVTNWRYSAANTAYPWAVNKPDPIQVKSKYVDYNAPAYFEEFADFLAANGGTPWEISQYRRCAASADWIIQQMYNKGYIASAGDHTISDDGSVTTFGSFAAGEDFRLAWRTILNYVWHGNPTTTWNPVTHQIVAGGNTSEYDMALRHKEFLKFPNSLPSTSANAFCSKLGASPDPGQPNWKGVAQIKQQYAPNGSVLANYGVNWMAGTGAPAAVASGDLDLTAELYRQCELSWDDQSGSAKVTPALARYINSTPKYFHGWFRTLGMLTASGNLHAPEDMVAAANMKVYMDVDKTFAYEGDLVNYEVSYRNYGSVNAAGVTITTIVDPAYQIVSAAGGTISGNTITWSIGTVPGFKTNGLAATKGVRNFTVKVKPLTTATIVCLTSTITSTNAPIWTSNEYPNNVTYTMERNCVDLLKDRVLAIEKTTDRSVMNPGDVVNFTLNFENKTGSNLWLNGGRDRVILSYANYLNGTSFYQFYRIWHSAQEAYINLGNYRVSYFMNDGAAIGKYNAATNPTGWDTYVDNQNDLDKYGYNPLTLPVNQQLNFTYQKIPWGSDANGAWNQRVITQFAQVLSAPSTHIFDKLDSEYLIHKGVVGPGFTRTRFESKPSSNLGPRVADDWSYDPAAASGNLDGQGYYFFPVTPAYTNFNSAPKFAPVVVNNYSKDACGGPVQNFSKVLFEEFDGYTWRRIAGNGPLPGRETYNVVVTDSIPIELAWSAFTDDNAVGVTATYTPLTGNPKFSGYVKWSIPVMLTGETGNLSYKTIAKSPCAEKTFINAGWIWSDVDSPDSSAVNLRLTCNAVPPTPPTETSLVKTADKTNVVVGDLINYTLTFTNKDGSTASWAGAGTVLTDWQTLGSNVTIPKLNNAVISLDQNGGNNSPGSNGYAFGPKKAHGKNGYVEATIVPTNSSNLSFIYRYQSGTPGQSDFQGVRLEMAPNNGGNNGVTFTLYNNATAIATLTGLTFPGSFNPIKIRTQLLDDKLYIWVNDFSGAPLKVISGITQLGAGYAGLFGNGSQQSFSAYTAHFDSAFDLVLTDPVPTQLNNVTNISHSGALVGSTVTWPTVAGPILANAIITRTFTATVNTCTDFITNIGKATVYGVTNIQSQNVVLCGAVTPPCTKPTITSAATGSVCSGIAQSYSITSSLPSTYTWTRAAVTGITPATGSGSTATITETLTNSGTTPLTVTYVITPTATSTSCVGNPFNYVVTVNPTPTITGTATVCAGSTVTLTGSATAHATTPWTSASPLIATVTSGGVVSGVAAGTSVITYMNTNGCTQTQTVTVNAKPTITGASTVCVGSTITLTGSATAHATTPWTSASPLIATVTNAGVVTGVAAGTSVITYMNTNGCTETLTITVNAKPTITGVSTVCAGSTITLTGSATAHATTPWTSASPLIATVTSGGVVSGVAAGTSVITYMNANGCTQTQTITVNAKPTITGASNVCAGSTITLTGSATAHATTPWTSASPLIATVTNAGVVTGVAAGTSVITYMNTNGCTETQTVTVTASVTPSVTISTPSTTICTGTSVTFTATPTNGGIPTYQWYKNTVSLGTSATNATYTTTAAANNDSYTVVMTSTATCASPLTATSNAVVMTVTTAATPAVSITAAPAGSICAGTSVTFTAVPGNGGSAPTYEWFVNNVSKGAAAAGATTFTSTTLSNSDQVKVIMTSNSSCVTAPGTATSNVIIMAVDPPVTPSVTIATPSTTICTGTSITFTATPVNGGTTPTYQWRKNNVDIVNATNATYTTSSAVDNDSYTVMMTSTAACASPLTSTSNAIVITVTTVVTPAVTIAVSPGTTICAGASITFTATAGNGGTTPTYQWRRNGGNIASATNATYTTTAAANGDTYDVIMTSNSSCVVAPGTATSNVITMTVNPNVTPSVAIAVSPTGAICPNTSITFTATPTNGGTPTYQWQLGGSDITNATNATYTTTTAANNDSYRVVMTSNATCVSPATATSTPIVITVTPTPTPGVSIVADKSVICSGQTVVFTATPLQGGSTPTYVWKNNGVVISGETTASLSISTLGTPNSITVEMVSNALCAPATAAVSNAIVTTVNAGIGAGTIGNPQTICYNTVPAAINQLTAATGVTGAATYQWQASLDGVTNWNDIPGATNTSYTPPVAITQDVYVRRVVTDATLPAPCNTATTPSVRITVRSQLVSGVIGSDESGICAGSATTTMSETTAPTGGTGTYTYQWQSSTSATGTFTDIASATNATYNAGNLSQDMYYQLVETSGTCGSVTTNVVSKTVSAPEVVTAVIDNAPSQVCITAGTIVFTANGSSTTGTGTLHYQWYLGTPGNPVGTDNPSYTYTISTADNGKTVGVIVSTSTACNAGTSTATYTLDIVSSITPTVVIATPNNPNCAGLLSTFTATPTNAGVGATYQWYVVPAGTQGNPVGAGLLTYSASNLANGDRVRVELTSTSGCLSGPNPFKSNEITMVIKPIPAPMIQETDQTVCSPASVTFHGTVTPGNTYEWRLAGAVVGTNANYTATQAGSYTLYEDNGTCNSTSLAVNLTVVQTPIANAGADIYLKQGETGNLNGSGGSSYSWSPATYLSSSTVSNPSFTATQTITYTLTVSNTSGTTTCSTTDDVTVFVVSPVEVPNVITVNGDGNNDNWEIKNIEGYPNCIIEIYNRWGNLVWKSEGYPKNWDGTNFRNGQVLPDGTYFYIINLQSQIYDEPLTGWVQIIR